MSLDLLIMSSHDINICTKMSMESVTCRWRSRAALIAKAAHSSSVSAKTAGGMAESGPQDVLIPSMSKAIPVSFPVSERNR
jgi:hypothetical protein